VIVAGIVTGAIESVLRFANFGVTTALFVETFSSILIFTLALELVLFMLDVTAPVIVVVLSTTAGTVISFVLTHALGAAVLHSQAHGAHPAPVVPTAGFALGAGSLVAGLAIAAGQAFVIHSVASR
jgi:cell shape-determining protein MreD